MTQFWGEGPLYLKGWETQRRPCHCLFILWNSCIERKKSEEGDLYLMSHKPFRIIFQPLHRVINTHTQCSASTVESNGYTNSPLGDDKRVNNYSPLMDTATDRIPFSREYSALKYIRLLHEHSICCWWDSKSWPWFRHYALRKIIPQICHRHEISFICM
jgi:hypothetical protein